MIDTHLHLDLLGDDAASQLRAALDAGLTHCVHVGIDPRVPSRLPPLPPGLVVKQALGLHPQEVRDADDVDDALATLDRRLSRRGDDIVAIGETGLDARPDKGNAREHERAFRAQLALARRHDLPVVLHGVRRDGPLLAILDDDIARHGPVRGVWHGFSASTETMRAAVRRGLWISIGFIVLNQKARRAREAVPHIPDDRLLVETDAPPLPPARLVDVIAEIARLRGTTPEAIAALSAQNARALFRF